MGKKAFGFLAVVTASLSVNCKLSNIQALNVIDVYKSYGQSYTIPYPESTLDTIRKYTDSQKSVYRYHYVESSTFDKGKLKRREKELTSELEDLTDNLFNAYDLSIADIYELEDRYVEVERNLNNTKAALKSKTVKVQPESLDDIPTDLEYKTAMNVKDIYDSRANLGDTIKPTNSACIVKESSDDHTVFLIVAGSAIHPIWKGKVVECTKHKVIVYHYNKVYTVYSNISNIRVSKDDIVTQDTILGESNRELIMQLRLNGKFVDCSKLYEGGDEDG